MNISDSIMQYAVASLQHFSPALPSPEDADCIGAGGGNVDCSDISLLYATPPIVDCCIKLLLCVRFVEFIKLDSNTS